MVGAAEEDDVVGAAACCLEGLSETTGFLAGSAACTAKMEGVDGLGLLGKEEWLGFEEGKREWLGIKDLVGRRELALVTAIVVAGDQDVSPTDRS